MGLDAGFETFSETRFPTPAVRKRRVHAEPLVIEFGLVTLQFTQQDHVSQSHHLERQGLLGNACEVTSKTVFTDNTVFTNQHKINNQRVLYTVRVLPLLTDCLWGSADLQT